MGWDNQAVSLIILTEQTTGFSGLFGYSPFPAAGNLIFSVAAAAGMDSYGNSYPQGMSSTVGDITANSLAAGQLTINSGPLLFYGSSAGGGQIFAAGTSGNWTVPSGVTTVTATLIGGGGNGGNGSPENAGGGGGGGGECAVGTFTVVPGHMLAYSVGNATQNTTFNGITANAGGSGSGITPGAGGSGSTAAIHYAGGSGYIGNAGWFGGGGSSAGPLQPGNNGSSTAGGAAVPGGGYGGAQSGPTATGGVPGGGGAGGTNGVPPGNGGGGQLSLVYAGAPSATELLLAIASIAGSDAFSNSWGAGLTLASASAPAAPAAGCILYYSSGSLYAVGPSGVPVLLATT